MRGRIRCYVVIPLGATLSDFAERNPLGVSSRTQFVSVFLFGNRPSHLTYLQKGNNSIHIWLDTRRQEASPLSPGEYAEATGRVNTYGDVVGDCAGRLRTRKTPMVSTIMTVTFNPTSMRY